MKRLGVLVAFFLVPLCVIPQEKVSPQRTNDNLPEKKINRFWQATRDSLERVPMEPVVTRMKEPLPYKKFKVTVKSLGGATIVAWLSIPVQGESPAGPWPVIISPPGYGGWQQSVMLSECQRGYAILQVFPRGQGESGKLYTIKGGDKLTGVLNRPEDAYYRGAYADMIRMIDFVCSRNDLDSGRIALVGTSQGGGIALALAALDPRVKAVVAHVPFLCNMRLAAQTPNSLVKKLLDRAGRNDKAAFRTLDYFDPFMLAPQIHIPVLMSAGGKDEVCPMTTIRSVYDRLPGEKTLKIYPELAHTGCVDFYNLSWVWLNRNFKNRRLKAIEDMQSLPNKR